MSKARDLADLMSTGGILEDGALSTSEIVNVTAAPEELNLLDGATVTTDEINKLDGVTATTAELNKLAGTTATTSDFDKLSNVTASATELNYMTGATSSIQSQLDNISVTSGSLTKSFTNGESATITLAQSITPAPVVSVTKEVAQTGQSSKGAWDVNATASNYDLHNTAYATTLTKSTVGYDIANGSYDSKTITLANNINGMEISNDGTKIYYVENNGIAYQKTLSTAYDITTAGSSTSLDTSPQDIDPRDITLSYDGTKMYILGDSNNSIYQYTLSTAWDITTGSYANKSFSLASQGTNPFGVQISSDGTKLYVMDAAGSAINQYNLSTAFDVSTASYSNNSFSITAPQTAPRSIALKPDGTKMYLISYDTNKVHELEFGTNFDVSTLSYTSNELDHSANTTNGRDVTFSSDGTKTYILAYNGGIFQYSTGANSVALGTGSFASTDVGKRIQGNGGDVILTNTSGVYSTTGGSDFTDSSTIASGSWTMHGLKSAGADDGLTLTSAIDSNFVWGNYTKTFNVVNQTNSPIALAANADGSKWFVYSQTDNTIYQYNTSTTGDITTNQYTMSHSIQGQSWATTSTSTFEAAGDGSRFYATGATAGEVYQATTGNGSVNGIGSWTGYTLMPSGDTAADMFWKPDGSKLYIKGADTQTNPLPTGMTYTSGGSYIYSYDVPTAWDISSIVNPTTSATTTFVPWSSWSSAAIIDNGTRVIIGRYNQADYYVYKLTTAWDITSIDYTSEITENAAQYNVSSNNNEGAIGMTYINDKLYTISYNEDKITEWPWGGVDSYSIPTSQYNLAITNASGQIDSAFWQDINSMTADQSLGDGEAYYAVSTDDRTTWSVAKGSDGVRPIVRDNAGTWQYNNDAGTSSNVFYDMSSASYDNKSFNVSSQTGSIRETHFNNTGTKMYVISDNTDAIFQYSLSTAFDVSTASYDSVSFSVSSQLGGAQGFCFNDDGTKMYVNGEINDTVYQYSLSTAFDLTTATYANKSLSLAGVQGVSGTIVFNDNGTKLYVCGEGLDIVGEYNLTTAYDVSTGSYSVSYNHSLQTTSVTSMAFNNNGTKMFLASRDNESVIYQYTLSTAYDVTSASYDGVSFNVAPQLSATFQGIVFNDDGSKLYVTDNSGVVVQYSSGGLSYSYSTSTTWTNATTNDEFYALQQALGATEFNRMDKTQLDAVADGSHFTLGNTLDLMIALKQDTSSASLPTSDGVTINYDAEALNQGAVLGTDYDFDFPANNQVRITSNAAQNLKIRVV